MLLRRMFVPACAIALVFLPGIATFAAPSQASDGAKEKVLSQLNVAAKSFHSTSAEFEFDSVLTDPLYEKNTQKGTVDYKRSGKSFQMAIHILVENDRSVPKDLVVAGGKITLFDKHLNQVHVNDASKYESYLLLGFGASGDELADKWDIKYLGSETLSDGKASVKTEKLELIAKDSDVRKLFAKVTIWIDPERAVSLKQIFDEGQGQSRTCYYSNIKLNAALPESDFTIKTDNQTQFSK